MLFFVSKHFSLIIYYHPVWLGFELFALRAQVYSQLVQFTLARKGYNNIYIYIYFQRERQGGREKDRERERERERDVRILVELKSSCHNQEGNASSWKGF